jgi:hypothetical protein
VVQAIVGKWMKLEEKKVVNEKGQETKNHTTPGC